MTRGLACHRYVYGGLQIVADAALERLSPTADGAAADIEISFRRLGAPPKRERQLYALPGRFQLSLWTSGPDWVFRSAALDEDVLVSADGRVIRCFPRGAPSTGLAEFLIRRVLPRVAQLHGRLTLHAGLVLGPHGALLLTGPSGAGKSTLTTALGLMVGWRQLSDDISILSPDGGGVWASAPGAYLTPSSAAGLGFDQSEGGGDPSHSGKAWFGVGAGSHAPAPIAGLLFLARRPNAAPPRLVAVPRPQAFAALQPQLIAFDPSNATMSAQLFGRFGRLVGQMSCYQLDYPSDYAALPAVAAALATAGAPVPVA